MTNRIRMEHRIQRAVNEVSLSGKLPKGHEAEIVAQQRNNIHGKRMLSDSDWRNASASCEKYLCHGRWGPNPVYHDLFNYEHKCSQPAAIYNVTQVQESCQARLITKWPRLIAGLDNRAN